MQQSRFKSLLESLVNLGAGYIISLSASLLIFPYFGVDSAISQNAKITLAYSVISLIRLFIVRRAFS